MRNESCHLSLSAGFYFHILFLSCQHSALESFQPEAAFTDLPALGVRPSADAFHRDRFVFKVHDKYDPLRLFPGRTAALRHGHAVRQLRAQRVLKAGFCKYIFVERPQECRI